MTMDGYAYHSPLNSNAVVSLELQLSLPELRARFLQRFPNHEVLSLEGTTLKLKFFDKKQAQQLVDELNQEEIDATIHFDTLTHPGNIYVRGLVPEVTTQDLFEIFEPFGEVTSCKICFDEFGQSKGYGFINFSDGKSADEAIEKLNGLLINGSKFYLNHHIAKKERIERLLFEKQNFTNLYFKNFPTSYDEPKIKELFTKFGEINSLFLPELDPTNESSKRFGFINYKNHESAVEAILNLDNKELESGVHISVSRAQRRDERKSPLNIPPTLSVPVVPQGQILSQPIHGNIQQIPGFLPPHNHSASSTSSSFSTSPIPYPYQHPSNGQTNTADIHSGLPLPGPHQQQSNLYVKNLTQSTTDEKLTSIFSQFGSIINAKIMTLEDGITSRGFGFVCFKTVGEASRAMVAMNGSVLDSEVIHVSFAHKNNKKLANKVNNHGNGSPHNGSGVVLNGGYPGAPPSFLKSPQSPHHQQLHGNNGGYIPSYYYGIPPPSIVQNGKPGAGPGGYYYGVPPHSVGQQYDQFNGRYGYKPKKRINSESAVDTIKNGNKDTKDIEVAVPNQESNENSETENGESFNLDEKVNLLIGKISKNELSQAEKLDLFLKEIVNPLYSEYSNGGKSSDKSIEVTKDEKDNVPRSAPSEVFDLIKDLVESYESKYDEILNDLSNEELKLSEEFSKLGL